jgi:uncharacterized protein YcgI (DUF1989 family)
METMRHRIAARTGASFDLKSGQKIRVISPNGGQVADLFAFNAANPAEYLSARHTLVSETRHLYPRAGQTFLTSLRRPILRFVEDGAREQHEMLLAACDPARYRLLGYEGHHASCAENLQTAMAARGLALVEIPQPLNLFSSTRAEPDGRIVTHPNVSHPGDYAVFEALMDAIVVVSACPFDLPAFTVNEGEPQPIDVQVG